MASKITITGTDAVLRDLKKFGDEANRKVAFITKVTSEEMATNAMRNAPTNFGKIKQGIESEKVSDFFYNVVAKEKYSPYVEFGTGAFVEVAPEWSDFAWTFYVNGKGYLKPQPYLYPAFQTAKINYPKDLENLLKQLTNKF